VVQNEPFERTLTARHLRKAGLEVIEAASEDQARRVLDAVTVDIVFADLETPGQANEFSLLRLLYEHHPGARTILTSGAEADSAAAEGYGIFLRRPYRLVDLDSSIQRTLAAKVAKRRRAADSARIGPDEAAGQRLAELSRQLAERATRQRAVDPEIAKAARRDALTAHDRAHSRRLRLILGLALGAVLASGLSDLPAMFGSGPVGSPEQASAVEAAATTPAPVVPEVMSPSTAQSSPLPGAMPAAEQPGPGSPLPPGRPGSIDFDKQAS